MVEFKSWEELSDLEQAQATYWDMYKDAHNFRPRHVDTSAWTMADFDREFTELGQIMKANHASEQIAQAKAVVVLKTKKWPCAGFTKPKAQAATMTFLLGVWACLISTFAVIDN